MLRISIDVRLEHLSTRFDRSIARKAVYSIAFRSTFALSTRRDRSTVHLAPDSSLGLHFQQRSSRTRRDRSIAHLFPVAVQRIAIRATFASRTRHDRSIACVADLFPILWRSTGFPRPSLKIVVSEMCRRFDLGVLASVSRRVHDFESGMF